MFTARCLPRFLQIKKMWTNTKLLISASLLIIITGFGLLWLGSLQTATTAVLSPVVSPAAVQGIEGEKVIIFKVVDGDTIELEDGKSVRFVGIDTPETVDPRRPVGCFGKEASNETKKLLSGKMVILQKDITDTDKYGRLLRYIFLPLENNKMLFINDYLVREGFARAKNYPPDDKFKNRFQEAELKAKQAKKGLWGKCI